MNKATFYRAIENTQVLDQLPVDELQIITRQFPYFTAAHHLLLRKYQRTNDHRFTDQLHTAAVHSNDRKILFRYVNKTAPAMEVVETVVVPVRSEENSSGDISSGSTVQATTLKPLETESPELQVATEVTVKSAYLEPLQREIIVEAVSSSIEKEVTEDIVSKRQIVPKEPHQPTVVHEDSTDQFTSWLFRRAGELHYQQHDPASGLITHPHGADDRLRTEALQPFDTTNEGNSPENVRAGDKREIQRKLIDRFIQLEPRITPGKAEDYLTGNIARTSVEEDLNIVSETIAELYVKQGKIDRARKAYKKLIEIYPEKSIYFAARLKNLDKNKK